MIPDDTKPITHESVIALVAERDAFATKLLRVQDENEKLRETIAELKDNLEGERHSHYTDRQCSKLKDDRLRNLERECERLREALAKERANFKHLAAIDEERLAWDDPNETPVQAAKRLKAMVAGLKKALEEERWRCSGLIADRNDAIGPPDLVLGMTLREIYELKKGRTA
jgi:predicted RNase H-like nuclease (RuvC/YqgF family)